jgi:hypothetical protein
LVLIAQHGAIGGEHRHKIIFLSHTNEVRQVLMHKRFTHQMKVKKPHMPLYFIDDLLKLLRRHRGGLTFRFGAKNAIKIAHVGYFQIAPLNHA